jgi:DNA-nicking Smr family endonuclease
MTSRKSRPLRPEEKTLWRQVQETAQPLHVAKRPNLPKAVKEIMQPPAREPRELQPFHIGERAGEKRPVWSGAVSSGTSAGTPAPRMDAGNFKRMKRGKLLPEARLDLHGMTLSQAHPRLMSFVMNAHSHGHRLVLVITGKGRDKADTGPIPVRKGVLRHQVPQWLQSAPLSQIVLQVSEAHARHGGGGALYVYLRNKR